jgi:transcriptional regulator with XRE-family HTH domain
MNERLVEFRKTLNLNQFEMAKSIGVSKSYYSKIELGLRNPSYNFIQKFKTKFGADIDSIFFTSGLHGECG